MMAVVVISIFAALIVTAYLSKGRSEAIIGSFGIFTVILSVIGLITGIRGFRERDKNYTTCKAGIGINGAVLLLLVAVFIGGMI